jgi:tetratricopeptide (TPR) repeat protein
VRRSLHELHTESFQASLATCAELRRRWPDDPAGYLGTANVYQTMMRDYRLRDHEPEFLEALAEARRLAEAAVRSRPDAEAFFARATARGYIAIHDARSGRWLPALRHGLRCLGDMERAAQLDPGFLDPHLPMALHDYWKSRKLGIFFKGRRPGAIARMDTVWRQGRYLSVEAAYSLSMVLQMEGAYERALEVNDWLHERFPDNPVCLNYRARILEGLDRSTDALQVWDRLVERLLASGRLSQGFLAECHLHRARLLARLAAVAGSDTEEAAMTAVLLAKEHARRRDPRKEMQGPFEDFDDVRGQIVRLEASLGSKAPNRVGGSRCGARDPERRRKHSPVPAS